VAEQVRAERHERTPERSGYRNGYRERLWHPRWVRSGMFSTVSVVSFRPAQHKCPTRLALEMCQQAA